MPQELPAGEGYLLLQKIAKMSESVAPDPEPEDEDREARYEDAD